MQGSVTQAVQKKALQPDTLPALAALIGQYRPADRQPRLAARHPGSQVSNVRNDIYLADTTLAWC